MDNLIRTRQPIRSTFTKSYNKLVDLLNEVETQKEEVESKLASLERVALNLANIDNSICETLLLDEDPQKYEDEYDKIESYREKLDHARVLVNAYLKKITTSVDDVMTVNAEKTKLKLPKIELTKYGGEIKNWLTFWSQFKRIHENTHMENEDKFQYLIQCMIVGSRAREIVDSYPPTAENYLKCVESLKTRFGREELLVEYYVRELLGLVVKNVTNVKTKVNITQLYDKLESHLRSLESIGMTSDKYAAMLFPLVESCIPEEILRVWLRNSSIKEVDNSYSAKLNQLLIFLRAEVEGEERISLAKAGFRKNETFTRHIKFKEPEISIPTANDLVTGVMENKKRNCIFCGKLHESKDCFKGQTLSQEEKTEILKNNKCCFTCLKVGHRSKFCKANVRCIICGKRHWAVLCPDLKQKYITPKEETREVQPNVTLSNQSQTGEVLLQTLLVAIEVQGRSRIVRALIDTGSQRSYILKSTADQLGLKANRSEVLTHIVFGGNTSKQEHKSYSVKLNEIHHHYSCQIEVLDQSTICGAIPRIQEGPWINELKAKGIQLSDTGRDKLHIELLIGADFVGKLYSGRTYELKCGLTAVQTHLGWVVMGKFADRSIGSYVTSLFIQTDNIQNLWKLEAIGISDPCETTSREVMEAAVTDHFKKTVHVNKEGRYEVNLPWMHSKDELPINQEVAEKRLNSTTSKLLKEGKFDCYDTTFDDWFHERIISTSLESGGHFLPHRGVFKTNSTTNVRPVFDASCKQKGLMSLNDCLANGPNLLELIPSLLLRFREERIGVISDIKKAFLQISVSEDDRNYLKFLWWEDKTHKRVKVYHHCRVVFGLKCSPYLLGAVIHHHLDKYSEVYPDIVKHLKNSFYVDNCVTSVGSEVELQNFVNLSTHIMAEAKFDLRGWEHSGYTTNACINSQSSEPEPSHVLGYLWDKMDDVLFCDLSSLTKPEDPITRRNILSTAHRIFDPIGFTCPVTVRLKLLLQESWKSKLSWDSEVPENIRRKFLRFFEELEYLNSVKIPRRAFLGSASSLNLHVFCDASGSSYAAVVYLRCETKQAVSVQLLMAKSRVAPLKKISIPRLELLSCCIGARLAEFVKNSLEQLKEAKEYYWTDSSTALSWIKKNENWGTFVHNRVKEIRHLAKIEDWRHVPGVENPADLPSRGCSVKKLKESRWWEGPYWLAMPESTWPLSNLVENEEEVNAEKKKSIVTLSCSSSSDNSWILSYFSSYNKILRMISWMLRFIRNARQSETEREKGELKVCELSEAEKILVKLIQLETFSKEHIKSLKSISVFKDEEDILRIRTKLTERKDHENFVCPMLLPSNHRLVEYLILDLHRTLSHAGLHILMSKLREKFWICKSRKTIRKALAQCIKCKRHEANRMQCIPATLPENRVRDSYVFEVTGVDLAGPLTLKDKKKAWIILFTCAVYRGIHLELITSLSTQGFLLGLRRFIARRGRPKTIYSDNGSNFIGANNLFKSVDWKIIEVEASLGRIQWIFNPPAAPWWGGFWERMIQMVKKLLRRVLGYSSLNYEELMSMLCDCEATINSRPLTYVSENSDDLIPLTPAMFMNENVEVGVPDLDHLDQVNLNKRLRYQQELRDTLRKRFRNEYLSQLLQRPSKIGGSQTIKIGDIVLIENEGKRRIFWPMARVIQTFPGKDSKIRVVRLKTVSGEIIRPIQRIFPLEISSEEIKVDIPVKDKNIDDVPDVPLDKRTIVTKRGRTVRIPSRFLD